VATTKNEEILKERAEEEAWKKGEWRKEKGESSGGVRTSVEEGGSSLYSKKKKEGNRQKVTKKRKSGKQRRTNRKKKMKAKNIERREKFRWSLAKRAHDGAIEGMTKNIEEGNLERCCSAAYDYRRQKKTQVPWRKEHWKGERKKAKSK